MDERVPCLNCGEIAVRIGYQAKNGGSVYQCRSCGYSFLGLNANQLPKIVFEKEKDD